MTQPSWLKQFRWGGQAFWPALVLAILLVTTMPAEFVANDRPLAVSYVGYLYFPAFRDYPETMFGGDFETTADFTDAYLRDQIERHGWMLWPVIPSSETSPVIDLPEPSPTPPSHRNWLGTDSAQRDVLARLIYALRASLMLGAAAALICSVATILAKRRLAAAFYMPAIAVVTLAAVNFAGLAAPGSTASLGGLLREGLANPNAPWLGFTGLFGLAAVVIPLVFLGRALHDASKDA